MSKSLAQGSALHPSAFGAYADAADGPRPQYEQGPLCVRGSSTDPGAEGAPPAGDQRLRKEPAALAREAEPLAMAFLFAAAGVGLRIHQSEKCSSKLEALRE